MATSSIGLNRRVLTVESANNFNTVYIKAVQYDSFVWICGYFKATSSKTGNVAYVRNAGRIYNGGNSLSSIAQVDGNYPVYLDVTNLTNSNDIQISVTGQTIPANAVCRFNIIYPLA